MTTILFWVTIGGAVLLVAVLAIYLLAVIGILASIRRSAREILGATRTIGDRAEPIDLIVTEINTDLAEIRDALQAALPDDEGGQSRERREEPEQKSRARKVWEAITPGD